MSGREPLFKVGKLVEITANERRLLESWAYEMQRRAALGDAQWFRLYLEAHRESRKVLDGIIKRSHAN